MLAQFLEALRIVEVAADVGEVLGEVAPQRIFGRPGSRELVDRSTAFRLAKLVVVPFGSRESDDSVVAGKMSPSRRLYIAGINMRFIRSPLAPKKMTLQGR